MEGSTRGLAVGVASCRAMDRDQVAPTAERPETNPALLRPQINRRRRADNIRERAEVRTLRSSARRQQVARYSLRERQAIRSAGELPLPIPPLRSLPRASVAIGSV